MAPKKDYSEDQMMKAIEEVRRGVKVAVAATKFGVPRITLRNKITGKSPITCRMGPSTILTAAEEDILVKWILELSDRHFPIGKDELLDSVQRIIVDQNRENPFTNNRPGKKWYKSFLSRHPEIVTRAAQNLTSQRNNVTEENLKAWFNEIQEYLKKENLLKVFENPARIFNADESAFFLQPKPGRVLTRRGEKNVYTFSGDEKENLTVLVTANASGQLAPPVIIFPYERIPSHIARSVPGKWGIGKSDNGWMCRDTFYEYMTNIFNPWLIQENIPKPVLFFMDGHASHMSVHLSKFCSENGIELFALYPNSTHILQPMDLAVFRPLKLAWNQQVNKWKTQNLGEKLSRETFAPVFQLALLTITEDCIKNGFRGGGLCPFGLEYIDLTKLSNHNRQTQTKTTRRSDFLINLESDIVNVFSQTKLDLFNKLYYMARPSMEKQLPDEDQSLYIIWAKNKDTFLRSDSVQADKDVNNENLERRTPSVSNIESSVSHDSQNDDVVNADTNIQSEEIIVLECTNVTTITSKSEQTPFSDLRTSLSAPSPTNQTNPIASILKQNEWDMSEQTREKSQKTPAANIIIPSPFACPTNPIVTTSKESERNIPDKTRETPQKTPAANIIIPSSFTCQTNPIAITSKQNEWDMSEQTRETPQKTPATNIVIPSPFKRALFWPDEIKTKKKRRLSKEKLPSTITSQAWMDYNIKKENEKKRKLEEKAQRLKIREEKKILKKQQTKNKPKKTKISESSDSSSAESLSSKGAAEKKQETKSKPRPKKRKIPEPSDSSSEESLSCKAAAEKKQETKSKPRHKKRKIPEPSDSSSEESLSTKPAAGNKKSKVPYAESASSDGEWYQEDDVELLELETMKKENIRKGQFIVVMIKGGKRMTVTNKFLCCIDDVEGDDIKITGTKAVDSTYTLFSIDESDSSFITFNQIVGLIQEEDYTISLKGERLYYKFNKKVPLL